MNDIFKEAFDRFVFFTKVLRRKDLYIKKDIKCNYLTYGKQGANWTFCPDTINEHSVVYSLGVGYDVAFELDLINNLDVTVHAFDPTPKSIKWVKKQNLPKQFVLHEYGVANFDGKIKFHPPENPEHISATVVDRPATRDAAYKVDVKSLATIMNELNHKQIDLIKINIEGAEYLVIEDLIAKNIKPGQILVEFHHRFEKIELSATKKAIKGLRELGYKTFFISKAGKEVSFIHKDLIDQVK